MRPVPKLRRHATLGLAYVQYALYGRRRYRYFGPWGSRSADAKYRAFCRNWFDELFGPWPEPGKWSPPKEITHAGRTQSVLAWAIEKGIPPSTLSRRLRQGWDIAKAIETPARRRVLTLDGTALSLSEWAARTGLKPRTIRYRLDVLKWTVERALTVPAQPRSGTVSSA